MLNKNSILMKIGEVEFFVRLIEKKFPDYKTIIPGEGYNKVEVKIQKDKTKPTLKRISIISSENNRPVVFSFKGDMLEVFTEDSELGNVKETLKLEETLKEDFSFNINCTYLLDILNAVDDDVIIEFNTDEEDRPVIVRPVIKKENVKFIIMPMVLD
jgi:DNA polymerase-3 subunit beta